MGQGLPTLRVECTYRWKNAARSGTLRYSDHNFDGRIGWREITAIGDRATIAKSDVPTVSNSARLTKYPKNQLRSPSSIQQTTLTYDEGGAAAAIAQANPIVSHYHGLTSWFTDSVQHKRFSFGLALLAAAVALILGAFHALYPGHGKTVMAAYLVGQRGSTRQGMLLGVTVAVTHTIGVLVLGLVLTTTQAFAPEQIYPYLGALSGACFVALGVVLFVRSIRQRRGFFVHGHSHGDGGHAHAGHSHDAHDHGHSHSHDAHSHGSHSHGAHERGSRHDHGPEAAPALTRKSLMTLGFAGGMVPTPSAVVVLLGATAIGRAWFGVVLVTIYGVGMAATLIAAGLALAWARRRFEIERASARAMKIAAILPSITGLVVMGGGIVLIARALTGG